MGRSDQALTKALQEKGMQPILPGPYHETISITIDGSLDKEDDLEKLLEDTLAYIRASKEHAIAKPLQKVETAFQRISVNDLVSLKHRS